VAHASWRPPVGDEVLFTDYGIDGPGYGGIYVMRPDGGPIRTILPSADGRSRGLVGWSPDGTRIAYSEWTDADDLTVRTHIINADGTGDRVLALPSGAVWEDPVAWSNDGTRLVSIRGYDGGNSRSRAVARPVDGNETGIEIAYPGVINQGCCSAWEWAPDDTSILGTPTDVGGWPLQQVKLDPKTGTTSDVSWSTTSAPTWQRLARTK
jgi:Tol biopolymer transport system component